MLFTKVLSSLAALSCAVANTVFTGDVRSGVPVISYLSLEDVPTEAITRYYLQVPGYNGGGLEGSLPIWVARGPPGTLNGKKLTVSAGIHGDEHNGIRVSQLLYNKLEQMDLSQLQGTIITMPTLNPSGNYLRQRNYFTAAGSGSLSNMNRLMPGSDPAEGADGPNGQVYLVWNNVWGNTTNTDVHVDFHTASTGTDNPLWCYADYRAPYVQRMAELLQPDVIKVDVGEPGSIETTMVEYGIPSITVELGSAQQWRPDFIERGYQFMERLMVDMELIASNNSMKPEPDLSNTFVGKVLHTLPTVSAGWAETFVKPLDDVYAGQKLGHVYNAFGDVLDTVYAPVDGKIFSIIEDPAVEPGRRIAQLVYKDTSNIENCDAGCFVTDRGVPGQNK